MHIGDWRDVAGLELSGDDMTGVVKRVLLGPADGWEGWVMRAFELAPGGHTPRHRHDWPHINVMLEGSGRLLLDGAEHEVSAGGFAFVPAGAEHQFSNPGDERFAFICIVPECGEG